MDNVKDNDFVSIFFPNMAMKKAKKLYLVFLYGARGGDGGIDDDDNDDDGNMAGGNLLVNHDDDDDDNGDDDDDDDDDHLVPQWVPELGLVNKAVNYFHITSLGLKCTKHPEISEHFYYILYFHLSDDKILKFY